MRAPVWSRGSQHSHIAGFCIHCHDRILSSVWGGTEGGAMRARDCEQRPTGTIHVLQVAEHVRCERRGERLALSWIVSPVEIVAPPGVTTPHCMVAVRVAVPALGLFEQLRPRCHPVAPPVT